MSEKKQRKEYPKPLKVYIWRFYDKKTADLFERFTKLGMLEGKHVDVKVEELIAEFNSKYSKVPELISELDLITHLREKGQTISRMTLKKWRENGTLETMSFDENGEVSGYWCSDGRHISYNFPKILKFLKVK